MNYCIDCKYFLPALPSAGGAAGGGPWCAHDPVSIVSPLFGPQTHYRDPALYRDILSFDGGVCCGPEARFFEALRK